MLVECFTKALRYDREDGELNLLLGRTLNDLDDFERAAAFLEKAVFKSEVAIELA